ncbi:unnamed protein product [Orchesella dallaii]|uniref:ditrans,polycis-polyprenyl diphosphate synthase [(2E,6E)-farnesyldiphosphate specific] n=1 Tax=Orchesella dallaii TaxID=48710 RepID=A0ABP1RM08_9HEXA
MALLKEKLEYKLEHPEELKGRCYRFIGNRAYAPEDLKPILSKLTLATRNNTAIVVNIAFALRDEIASGVNTLLKEISHKETNVDCINESLFQQAFHNCPVSSVDLFIRTGECRLSDFLTLETSDQAILCFRDEYWPSFSYWRFLTSIFLFQVRKFSIPRQAFENGEILTHTTWKGNTKELNEFVRKKIDNDVRGLEHHAAKLDKVIPVTAVTGIDRMFGCN